MSRTRRGLTKSVVRVEEEEYASLLTAAERAEIEEQVEAEIREIEIEAAREKYREEVRRERRIRAGLEEPQQEITIDCAGHAEKIVIDGKPFWQGHTYTVPASVAATLEDIMFRTWEHEWSIGGANANAYRRPLHTRVFSGANTRPVAESAPATPTPVFRPTPKVNFNTAQGVRGGRH